MTCGAEKDRIQVPKGLAVSSVTNSLQQPESKLDQRHRGKAWSQYISKWQVGSTQAENLIQLIQKCTPHDPTLIYLEY